MLEYMSKEQQMSYSIIWNYYKNISEIDSYIALELCAKFINWDNVLSSFTLREERRQELLSSKVKFKEDFRISYEDYTDDWIEIMFGDNKVIKSSEEPHELTEKCIQILREEDQCWKSRQK